ncbi:MAG: hypothetical protein ACXW3S_16455, partial [Rhodoplanes sp.]
QDADIALGPRTVHTSAEIAEVGMPERDMKNNGLEGSLPIFGQQILAQVRAPDDLDQAFRLIATSHSD